MRHHLRPLMLTALCLTLSVAGCATAPADVAPPAAQSAPVQSDAHPALPAWDALATGLAERLVNRLSEAKKEGKLGKLVTSLGKLDLLICDEWGYVPLDREAAQLLFQIISDSYEQRSVIITTNLEFSRWVGIFYDEQMTAAMIDRLIHHGYLLLFDGPSNRVRESLMRQGG